ncbi:hypothetical protein AXG93_2789s1010 [Marchantia polymorpha subsp. ruderalis]|uniref:Uncharacterized protein n=1 Tax=Marchantia polymorpha subsp. ruderalis TaxID=1480154 RepID=A0A176W9E6_MARPO|nr:hypothetical protein AXG93_2789s1010 [Marchantia polymorpha subsp. ruderalis]
MGDVNLAQPHSPSALDILAGSSEATVAAEDANISQPRSRQSPTNSVATEILNSEDDEEGGSTESVSGSESTEEEEQEVVGTPTAALCEQMYKALDKTKDEKLEDFAKAKAKLAEELDFEQA